MHKKEETAAPPKEKIMGFGEWLHATGDTWVNADPGRRDAWLRYVEAEKRLGK